MIELKGLQKVMDVFDQAGFSDLRPRTRKWTAGQQLTIAMKEARRLLGENWEDRLNGYTRKKFGHENVRECSCEELRDVFGFVRRTAKNESRRAGEGE